MIDYSIFYRRNIDINNISNEVENYDIFISAYNSSGRVQDVFSAVRAANKYWLIHPEYGYSQIEMPTDGINITPARIDEVTQVNSILAELGDIGNKSICIDITGFMRHVLVFILAKLAHIGIKTIDTLYSEPIAYKKQEDTEFSTKTSGVPRPVRGMSSSSISLENDYLIIAVGYDHKLVSEVASHKDSSNVYPIFAFPSLSPDMYQQSAERASKSGVVALEMDWISNRKFAPANDPFSTASVLSEIITLIDKKNPFAQIYLSPLSTKVLTLGFAIYWQLEGRNRGAISMLLPECLTYSRETSIGLKRLWSYRVELD